MTEELRKEAGYPAYQLYKDDTGATYCSRRKIRSLAEGNTWVSQCLVAHSGTTCYGKPWLSEHQSGTLWP